MGCSGFLAVADMKGNVGATRVEALRYE